MGYWTGPTNAHQQRITTNDLKGTEGDRSNTCRSTIGISLPSTLVYSLDHPHLVHVSIHDEPRGRDSEHDGRVKKCDPLSDLPGHQ